jgi:hypothetical protein
MDATIIAALISAAVALILGIPQLPKWRRRRQARKQAALQRQSSNVRTFLSREEAYSVIPKIIRRVDREEAGPKELLLAALHGHSGDRITSRRSQVPEFRSFDSALFQCVRSVGPSMWRVLELYNITSEERLDEVMEWLNNTSDDDGYEVRAFCIPNAIPHLAPLIVGRQNAFLGLEDSRYYRIQGAVHIVDEESVRLFTRYFYSLWNDRRVFILRSPVAVDEEAVAKLRSQIQSLRAKALSRHEERKAGGDPDGGTPPSPDEAAPDAWD